MAIIANTRGIDVRAILVGTDGSAVAVAGGQQYTTGDAAASPVGNVDMWDDVGTIRAVSVAKPLPVQPTTVAGAALSANPFPQGFLGATGALRYVTGANQVTNTAGLDLVGSGPLVYDTVNALWNRWRDANSASNSVGTGLAGAGVLGWDGAAYQRVAVSTTGEPKIAAGGFDLALPTVTFTRGANTTAYTIGDEVGTSGTAPSTAVFARANGFGGVIQGCTAVFSNAPTVTPSLRVLIFSATVTLAGDNAQLALSDAHAALCIGSILLTDSQAGSYSAGSPVTSGNLILSGAPTAPIKFKCGASETTLYVAVVTLNAFTPIANSETLVLNFTCEAN